MRFEVDSRKAEPVAVLEGNVLRFIGQGGRFYGITMNADQSAAWQSDGESFNQAIKDGGRVFYPGDTLTIRF